MNIVWAALIVLAATALAVGAMLAVRRRALEGSHFADSDRAGGIFGVVATGFSVLLGFLIFLGFESLQGVDLSTPNQEAAYAKWLEQTSTREEARQDRIHGASGLMPTPLWIALFFMSAIVFVMIFGFADSGERAWVQAMFMGSVVSVIVTLLLLLAFLDDPYQGGIGGPPKAMERTELIIDQQLAVIGGDMTIPCDAEGNQV